MGTGLKRRQFFLGACNVVVAWQPYPTSNYCFVYRLGHPRTFPKGNHALAGLLVGIALLESQGIALIAVQGMALLQNQEIALLESQVNVLLESQDIALPESQDISLPESQDIAVFEGQDIARLESQDCPSCMPRHGASPCLGLSAPAQPSWCAPTHLSVAFVNCFLASVNFLF